MTTYPTLQAAQAAYENGIVCVCEIEHATQGICYIRCKAPLATIRAVIARKPMPEIVRLIAEHPAKTPEMLAADAAAAKEAWERHLTSECHCERCSRHVDGHTAYRQLEWTRFGGQRVRVAAYYCEECKTLLGSIGQGEYTDLQARAGDVPSAEPYTKED